MVYWFERLEPRRLFSSSTVTTVGANINLSKLATSQSEGAIAIDKTNPNNIFAVSNLETGTGLFASYSTDGGNTWKSRIMATGSDITGACCDSAVAYDTHGNLFLSYISDDLHKVVIARSTDAGKTFGIIYTIKGNIDQPTITAGPNSVWVTFEMSGQIVATGAPISSGGVVGTFSPLQAVPGSKKGNFGDIAIGPSGQVMVTFQNPSGGEGPSTIYTSIDPDGLGPQGFTQATAVTSTNVGGFDFIPAQSSRSIDAEAGLAFDTSSDAYRGRVYMMYTDEFPNESNNTDVVVRFSDNNGQSWSAAQRVNDDNTVNSQFLPRLSLDPVTGNLAFSWYDCRNDNGVIGQSSTNTTANDDAQFWATVATPTATGLSIAANFQVSAGTTNAADAGNGIDLGDYTGLAFYNNTMFPLWADNSNSTGDNPDGALHGLDLYTAKVTVKNLKTGATSPALSSAIFGSIPIDYSDQLPTKSRSTSVTADILAATLG